MINILYLRNEEKIMEIGYIRASTATKHKKTRNNNAGVGSRKIIY